MINQLLIALIIYLIVLIFCARLYNKANTLEKLLLRRRLESEPDIFCDLVPKVKSKAWRKGGNRHIPNRDYKIKLAKQWSKLPITIRPKAKDMAYAMFISKQTLYRWLK